MSRASVRAISSVVAHARAVVVRPRRRDGLEGVRHAQQFAGVRIRAGNHRRDDVHLCRVAPRLHVRAHHDLLPALDVALQLDHLPERQHEPEPALLGARRDRGPAQLVEREARGVAADAGAARADRARRSPRVDGRVEQLADAGVAEDDLAGHVLAGVVRLAARPDVDDLGLDIGAAAALGERRRHLRDAGELLPDGLHQPQVALLGVPLVGGRKEVDLDVRQARARGFRADVVGLEVAARVLGGVAVAVRGEHLHVQAHLLARELAEDGLAHAGRHQAPVRRTLRRRRRQRRRHADRDTRSNHGPATSSSCCVHAATPSDGSGPPPRRAPRVRRARRA